MNNKSTLTTWRYKNIMLFVIFLIAIGNVAYTLWRLTFEPFFTNQLTTLTWFGLGLLIFSGIVAAACWEEISRD